MENLDNNFEKAVEEAIKFAKTQEFITSSMLQRYLGWGYNRAYSVLQILIKKRVVNKPESLITGIHYVKDFKKWKI